MYESGQVLQERYQLKQRLEHTAASRQTWLATDITSPSSESVILKLLAFGPQMDWQELELFEREAKILQALNHTQIPRYRDYFAIDRNEVNPLPWFALVQDYIPGSSLQELLDKGKHFSQKQVRQMGEQLLQILQYLHELSPPVLHRDIKPSNIILGNDRKVYLVDFGAVQDKAAVTGVSFTVVGTSGYAPFEQFYGKAVPASDLYALGATIIHLLTGIAPVDLLESDGSLAFAERINLDSSIIRPDWLRKLTELDLKKRFKSAREALKSLQEEERTVVVNKAQQTSSKFYRRESNQVGEINRDRQKIDRLELENSLLRIDLDWETEQEQYKVRVGKNSPPRLPEQGDAIFSFGMGVMIIVVVTIFGSQFFLASVTEYGIIIGLISIVFIVQSLYYWYKYSQYKEAYEDYQQRRASAIAWYEQKQHDDRLD